MPVSDPDRQMKIILMGLAESGKSTIIDSVFEGKTPKIGTKYKATINYQRKTINILGTELTFFDLGGQTMFLDRFIGSYTKFIFNEVDAFIYVIEALKIADLSRSKYYFDLSLERLRNFSPNAPIFIFLHKTDLIPSAMLQKISQNVKDYILSNVERDVKFFGTSVYSESISPIFGSIVADTIGISNNVQSMLEQQLQNNSQIGLIQIFTDIGLPLVTMKRLETKNDFSDEIIIPFFNRVLEQIKSETEGIKRIFTFEIDDKVYVAQVLDDLRLIIFIGFIKQDLVSTSGALLAVHDNVVDISQEISFLISRNKNDSKNIE